MGNSLTYPVPAIAGNAEDLTPEQIHQLLGSKTAISRRVRTVADQRFISDALLKGRYSADGGTILYETGEPVFSEDELEVIAPGGEYPLGMVRAGAPSAVKVDKWGRDFPIFDESIKRRGIDPVNKAISQGVNGAIRQVDAASLGIIASAITAEHASSAWTSAEAIVAAVELAKAEGEESGEGHTFDTIVLKPTGYARVMALFLAAGLLPRESANPLTTGWPTVLDLTWLRSPHTPTAAPLLVDTDELGGMGHESLGGPGYAQAGNGIETKVIRDDDTDGYRVRVRRVTVPVVTDPTAGILITGTGL